MIDVYVKLDSNNIVIDINSEIFLADKTGYVQIDSGECDKFAHAQSAYLEKGLCDSQGRFNYKLVNGGVVELSEDEKTSLFPKTATEPPLAEKNRADIDYMALMMGVSL